MDDGLTGVLVKRDGGRGWHRINKKDFDPAKHVIYTPPTTILPPDIPPPAPPASSGADPLANLSANWRDGDVADLKQLAATVSGRTVENVEQAKQVIEAELAKRQH